MKKYCPMCREVLPLEAFSRNKSRRDGRAGYCKECYNAYTHGDIKVRMKKNFGYDIHPRRVIIYMCNGTYREMTI